VVRWVAVEITKLYNTNIIWKLNK